MNTDKLFSLISEEEYLINELLLYSNKEIEFIDKVISENTMENITNINVLDIMTVCLYLNSKELDYQEIKVKVYKNSDLVKLENYNLLKKLKKYLNNKLNKDISKHFKTKSIDIESFKELQDNNKDDNIFDIFYIMMCIEKLKYELKEYQDRQKVAKTKRMFGNNGITMIGISSNIIPLITSLKDILFKISQYSKSSKIKNRKLKNNLSNYNKVKKILTDTNLDNITITEVWLKNILSLIENEKIQKVFLYEFGSYQKERFNK